MTDQPKLITEPHNPFLMETFRAFTAEGLPLPLAGAMTQAHIAHAHAKAAIDQATALERIATALESIAQLTDPVRAGAFLALLKAGEAKREETKEGRTKEDAMAALTALTGSKISLGDGFPVRNLTPETVTDDVIERLR
jgi:hypothetical protein